MSRLRTLLLSGPAPHGAVAVWFGDLPMEAPIECCYGPPSDPSAMGLWFPKLAADAKLEIIVGPAPAGPCMGIWRGTVLDWPGSVFMVGAPPKPRRSWRRSLVCPRAGPPASDFAAAAPALASGVNAAVLMAPYEDQPELAPEALGLEMLCRKTIIDYPDRPEPG